MVTAKATLGYKHKALPIYFEPSQEDLKPIYSQISAVTQCELNNIAMIRIKRLITFYRIDLYNRQQAASIDNYIQELRSLAKYTAKVASHIDDETGLSAVPRHWLSRLAMSDKDNLNILYEVGTKSVRLSEMCEEAAQMLKEKKPKRGRPEKKMRATIAIETARLFAEELHLKPTAYVNAKFAKVLAIIYENSKFTIDGKLLNPETPDDLEPIVIEAATAINNGTAPKMPSWLNEKIKYPGL
jgi:hypothetical protein